MQKINRQELNRRFSKVYQLLVEKGEIVKNDRQKSKTAFAGHLETKGHIIDHFLNGTRQITYEQAKLLCAKYHVNEAFMFQGVGQPFDKPGLPGPEEKIATALGINFSHNILFTNVEAFASNTVGVDIYEEHERFAIPGITGDLIAFNINGTSMAPTIQEGDLVICKPIESIKEMKDGEVYAVVSSQSVWVKRVQKCYDQQQNCTHLKLLSDNYAEYDPFTVEIGEVHKLLKVTRRVTGLG